jgi:hypothetical protein
MNRTQEAQLLLGNEFFKTVFQELEELQLSRFVNSNEEDINGRELAYIKLATLREIKSHIESIAASSEIRDKRWKIW